MQKFNFTTRTVNITNLKPHQVLTDFELDFRPNDYFTEMLKKYGLYEKPVVDMNGNVITHFAEIMAAKANGLKSMEVYEVDMNETELKLFILTKHTYNVKKVSRSYDIACFYRDYMQDNEEGKAFAKTIKGNINRKVAYLMDTSESTIKRLFYIGKNDPQYLHMVDEGNKSLHEARGDVNYNLNSTPEADKEPAGEKDASDKTAPKVPVTKSIPLPKVDIPIKFSDNCLVVDGKSVSFGLQEDGTAFISVDGKQLSKVVMTEIVHRDSEVNGKVKSLVFTQPTHDGISIQLTIENISNAA